ncbi:DUF3298 and DUF4163 domain-containing protein [Ichthyenterobacterium magnum]|uniref:Uncharacterized protein DUF3298 n=1 Tax=Ichthyenterobacterium magnum TaxID=1230530 RepID=A0A420DXS1_9FLAO|nr:DUF3298 and DUF4163 domain-containing protein [Ichthyenterobacterium magnum]RKE98996.1 uncharacterized protein DUF3298 [Ichthyenterobacterium magnum]
MKKIIILLLIISTSISCKKEVTLNFKEQNISLTENAVIDINYPKAEGSKDIANLINKKIENYIVNQTNMTEDSLVEVSIDDAIKKFNQEYIDFKNEFPDSSQQWEAMIDGEVTYQSPELICIAINSYLDTGGAHGNSYIKFLNFDANNGVQLHKKAIIKDEEVFSNIVSNFLKAEIENESIENIFFEGNFKLPESIGFNDEGVIILYNAYEIASYTQGITEFTIPYDEIEQAIKRY